MEIVLTGTGSPLPDANRAGPSTLVMAGDTHILVDAGRGTVIRLTGAGSLPALLGAVLVTHLHSDHVCALNDVITTHWIMTQGNGTLRIYGPPGIAQFVERQLHALEPDIGYRIEHHDALTNGPKVAVTELALATSFDVGDVHITTAATDHAPVKPTIGYRLEHDGATAALVGDTIPCDGVDTLASGVDAYVQTVIRRDLVEQVPNEMFQDILDYHSGVDRCCEDRNPSWRQAVGADPPGPSSNPGPIPGVDCPSAEHFDGEIVIGDDLTTITI